MKKYIQSLLLFALVCVGFASCNEQDMPDNASYPTQGPLLTWKSVNPKNGFEYYIITSAGLSEDTICNVIAKNQEGNVGLFMEGGRSEYDAKTGMFLNNFASSPFQQLPIELSMALRPDWNSASVQFVAVIANGQQVQRQCVDYFYATAQKGFPVVNTFWTNLDETSELQYALLFMPENKFMASVGEKMYGGTYEWNEVSGQGILHMADADETGAPLPEAPVKDQQVYTNNLNQFVMNIDGTEYLLKITQN